MACFQTTLIRAYNCEEAWKMIGYCYVLWDRPLQALKMFMKAFTYQPNDNV